MFICVVEDIFDLMIIDHVFWFDLGKSVPGGIGPLGKVEHFFYRIEYQARGAPHVHAVLWVNSVSIYYICIDTSILKAV